MAADAPAIKEPPAGFFGSFRFLGPGLILSAAIVGSGELIATTTLGAEAGYALMWVVLLGCLIKVGVQLEFGRHCITHGLTSFAAWNAPGNGRLRIAGLHWTVFVGLLFIISNVLGQGGVLGGASEVLKEGFPAIPGAIWPWLIAVVLAALIFHGRYGPVEFLCVVLNFGFVLTVLYCVGAVARSEYAFVFSDLAGGFSLTVPREHLVLAVSAFGITGVGAGEIFVYPTWCIEKGYAAWTGPREDSDAWAKRARGWIRVMTLDAVVSMAIYTVATIGFYILGAAILHGRSDIASGNELIGQLSRMFTDILGPGSMVLFLVCAFAVLFSTAFSNCASNCRLWTDLVEESRLLPKTPEARRKAIAVAAWVLPLAWAAIYTLMERPLLLITLMGVANSIFLIVVAYQAMVYRFRATDERLRPSRAYDVFLIASVLAIGAVAARSLYGVLLEG
jgi:manganese transport protein